MTFANALIKAKKKGKRLVLQRIDNITLSTWDVYCADNIDIRVETEKKFGPISCKCCGAKTLLGKSKEAFPKEFENELQKQRECSEKYVNNHKDKCIVFQLKN